MKKLIPILLLPLLTTLAQTSLAQVVVVGAKSPATVLSREQATSLFLGKSQQLPGGGIPLVIDQAEANEVRLQFYAKVTDKTVAQAKAIWSRLVFSGKGSPPKEVANSAEVKKLVNANPDAIGYIEKSAVDASVKVLYSVQ